MYLNKLMINNNFKLLKRKKTKRYKWMKNKVNRKKNWIKNNKK